MITGVGVDIVDIARFTKAQKKWGDVFLKRIFTDKEIAYSKNKKFPYQHFAARFATKEAVFKAFGGSKTSIRKWTDIEVVNDENGKPSVILYGQAKTIFNQKKMKDIMISMSHSHISAVANVILLG
ncbi:MAG: holo-ACP synthase [Candidatus Omnitrophica bacterium]|nr:holo-ACP synthase [Candidatus Omnitrophota bacterium]